MKVGFSKVTRKLLVLVGKERNERQERAELFVNTVIDNLGLTDDFFHEDSELRYNKAVSAVARILKD